MDQEELQALSKCTIKDLIELNPDFDLLVLEESDTVADALRKLQQKGVSSAPVRSAQDPSEMLGSIDILDLVCYIALKFGTVSLEVTESYRQMNEFADKKVKDLLDISERNEWRPMRYDKPMFELIALLASRKRHRVPILNETSDLVGYVTQTDVARFLYQQRFKLKKNMAATVGDMIKGQRPVTVNRHMFVITAFTKMWENNVTGLPVVDDNNALVGAISASDLKALHVSPVGPLIGELYEPIDKFKGIVTTTEEKIRTGLSFKPPVTVRSDDNLETALKNILQNHVHRVFVVDKDNRLQGVLSIGDIMTQFMLPEFSG